MVTKYVVLSFECETRAPQGEGRLCPRPRQDFPYNSKRVADIDTKFGIPYLQLDTDCANLVEISSIF